VQSDATPVEQRISVFVPLSCANLMQLTPKHEALLFASHNSIDGLFLISPALHPQSIRTREPQWPPGITLVETGAEFRKYAANCDKMAKVSTDPEAKALWRRMEERWLLCAKLADEDEQLVARHRANRVNSTGHLKETPP
jgi:hypothetical protein